MGGSLLVRLGVGLIVFSSAGGREQTRWKEAAIRESDRYSVPADFVAARMDGRQLAGELKPSRSVLNWLLVAAATSVFVIFSVMALVPQMSFHWAPPALLTSVLFLFLITSRLVLSSTTRFNSSRS